jgi:hypothetical protein
MVMVPWPAVNRAGISAQRSKKALSRGSSPSSAT